MPDFIISGVKASTLDTIWDLNRWLYNGGPSMSARDALRAIANGELGEPQPQRYELIARVHEVIQSIISSGVAKRTASGYVQSVGVFIRWMEQSKQIFELSSIESCYLNWTDHLLNRRLKQKDISKTTIYKYVREVGRVIDEALDRGTPIMQSSRVEFENQRKSPQGREAEKQNLEHTFAFGHLLQDICDAVTLDVLWGPSPVRVPLRNGRELSFYVGPKKCRKDGVERTPKQNAELTYRIASRIAEFNRDRTLGRRRRTVNFRVLAELMMFIGQTGMNPTQAFRLELKNFSYSADIDGFKVREYKNRRGGEVMFEIFKEYRSHFERYLAWRRSVFPEKSQLFALERRWKNADEASYNFHLLKLACKDAGVQWIPPSSLRSTRVNWMLRRSGDPDLTAEIAQHSKQTLISIYEIPSLQRSIGEITRFWITTDPTLAVATPVASVAPGACDGKPESVSFIPKEVAKPDCAYASGCMWCEHHRDIDSQDYVWSLACFRHLKILEASRYRPPFDELKVKTPGELTIERASDKLTWFRDSNSLRRRWVDEALARITEGHYHPDWVRVIEDVEVGIP